MQLRSGFLKRMIVLLLVAILITGTIGCSKVQKKPLSKSKPQSNEKNKPPSELEKIETGLEQLYQALQPPKPGVAQQGQQGGQQQQGSTGGKEGQQGVQGEQKQGQQGGDQQGSGQGNGGTAGGQQGGGKQPQQGAGTVGEQINWAQLNQQVSKLHQLWNSFEPKAAQAGANPQAITGFEKEINALPARLAARHRQGSQEVANNAASFIPDFLQLFESKTPPDLLRLRYQGRSVALRAAAEDWQGASAILEQMPAVWAKARGEAKGEQESEASKVQFALTDLKEAVQGQDRLLVPIKEQILEQNLKNVQKLLQQPKIG